MIKPASPPTSHFTCAEADDGTKTPPQIAAIAATLYHAEKMLTVARGPHLATAIEAALKIAETSGTTMQSFSSADLLHGPIASVAVRTPCLLFAPAGRSAAGMADVAVKLAGRSARVLRFAPDPDADVTLASSGHELLAPITDILSAQLLAYHLTVARGLDPDRYPSASNTQNTHSP